MGGSPFRVVVAGGGVAGLEALLALRELAGDRVGLTLICPEAEFVYRPMAVTEPFGRGHAARHGLARIARDLGVELVAEALTEVACDRRVAVTTGGRELPYDALLVTVGARSEPAFQQILTWTPERDPAVFGGLLADLEQGYSKRVAFVVPPGVAWPLPGYELALMTAWQAWGMAQDDLEVTVYTHEEAPLGPASTASGPPATRSRSRSSRGAWPPSRPTRPPSRSPRRPARRSTRSRSGQCCAA